MGIALKTKGIQINILSPQTFIEINGHPLVIAFNASGKHGYGYKNEQKDHQMQDQHPCPVPAQDLHQGNHHSNKEE